jgi:hypothetical protein
LELINEIRKLEGRSPYDGGDRYFIAVNNFSPADRIDEIIDKQVEDNNPQATKVDISGPQTDPAQAKLQDAAIRFLERK